MLPDSLSERMLIVLPMTWINRAVLRVILATAAVVLTAIVITLRVYAAHAPSACNLAVTAEEARN